MSDALLIAQELADISAGFQRVAEALAAVKPVITVTVPEAQVPSVVVEAPSVSVSVPVPSVSVGGPVVNVPPARPATYRVRVTARDMDGLISEFVLEPA